MADTYYVDFATGNDANNGTATGTPWEHCPDDPNAGGVSDGTSLSAGDTVIFKGGISYYGYMTCTASGTSGNRITYDGNSAGTWGTGKAIIDGQDSRRDYFRIGTQDYITIKNIECTNLADGTAHTQGIWSSTGATYITIQNCYIHDSKARGIYLSNASNVLIKDCEFSYHNTTNSFNYKVAFFDDNTDLTIEGCYIHHNGVGIVIAGATNVIIRYCLFSDNVTPGAHKDHFQIADATGVEVYCNMFEGDPDNVQSLSFTWGKYATGTLAEVWSNVVIGVGTQIRVRNGANSPTSNIKVYNNSFYGWGGRGPWLTEGSAMTFINNATQVTSNQNFLIIPAGCPYTGDRNYFYGAGGLGFWTWAGSPIGSLSAWKIASGEDANSNFDDPEYNSPASPTYNLSLQDGSPCIGAAQDLSGVDEKYKEALVPGCTFPNPETTTRAGAWDIGAYVYEAAAGATKVIVTPGASDMSKGSSTSLEVQVQDADNNLINDDNATNITFTPTSYLTITGVTTGTGDGSYGVEGGAETVQVAGGIAAVTLTSLQAGTFEVAVTNDGGLDNPANESIEVGGTGFKISLTLA